MGVSHRRRSLFQVTGNSRRYWLVSKEPVAAKDRQLQMARTVPPLGDLFCGVPGFKVCLAADQQIPVAGNSVPANLPRDAS